MHSGELLKDPVQEGVINLLNDLYLELNPVLVFPNLRSLADIFKITRLSKYPKVKGLYFWGGVGRGKTMLMDLFFRSLPRKFGRRYHFHRFMQRVHQEFTLLSGTRNPAGQVAAKLANECRVICFDEFYVSDIADAMILGNLFKELFEHHEVTLIFTSNVEPKDLYQNGLQRVKFLPAIDILYEHTKVFYLAAGQDFRLRTLTDARLYHFPIGLESRALMLEAFHSLADSEIQDEVDIMVLGRNIKSVKEAVNLVWFEFSELCEGARSQNDYIEISRVYQAVFLSGLPVFNEQSESPARRFISLVDEFYDRGVKLVIEAQVSIENLYQGRELAFEFRRTHSRLREMQSEQYLSREHH